MIVHVLPGDAMALQLKETAVAGEFVICRECLIEGELGGKDLDAFWQTRAAFIDETYGETNGEYQSKVRDEFEKLLILARDATEINLWFEYELFCQVNLWFSIFLLNDSQTSLFRVMPAVRPKNERWKGFAGLKASELEDCLRERAAITSVDRQQATLLWESYRAGDHSQLLELGRYASPALPHLESVCLAETQKQSLPASVLNEIVESGKTDFGEIFGEFQQRLGVYGFGDSQVRRILDAI